MRQRVHARVGHPDIPSFHHDLYRGMCASQRADAPAHGRWWVMEQQPGPVNWASWNPAPHDGMVRLWTWQAFAHGAEVVSYFRWRQAPFAQEQMHTGLHRPDRSVDQGGVEAAQVGAELQALAAQVDLAAQGIVNRVALVFDYDSLWMAQIQPQGADYHPLELQFRVYGALRQLGLDVDIVSPAAPLAGYALIVLPVQLHASAALVEALTQAVAAGAQIVFGPRAGAKTQALAIPAQLAPGALAELAGVRVRRVASLPPGVHETLHFRDGSPATAQRWREDLDLHGAQAEASFDDGGTAIAHQGSVRYVAGWLADAGWRTLLQRAAHDAGLVTAELPEDLRSRFAVAIFDEAQIMGAKEFSKAAPLFAGRRIWLSATPVRQDGLERMYYLHLGPPLLVDLKQDLKPSFYFYRTQYRIDPADPVFKAHVMLWNQINLPKLYTYLAGLQPRTYEIVELIRQGARQGRKILVLSTRRYMLQQLKALLPEAGVIHGGGKGG